MTSSPVKNKFIYLFCSLLTAGGLFIAATAADAVPMQIYGQTGLGMSLPYGSVVVPENHEAEIEAGKSFSISAGASWLFSKKLGLQAYMSYKRLDLHISYSGAPYNDDYNYRLNFGEIGAGVIGYYSPFSRFSFFYEGGLYYSMALPGASLFVDGQKADSEWKDNYEIKNEPGAFIGGGVIIPAAAGNVSLQTGLRYRIGFLPVLEGQSAMAYNNEEDSLHSMDISLYLGIVKGF